MSLRIFERECNKLRWPDEQVYPPRQVCYPFSNPGGMETWMTWEENPNQEPVHSRRLFWLRYHVHLLLCSIPTSFHPSTSCFLVATKCGQQCSSDVTCSEKTHRFIWRHLIWVWFAFCDDCRDDSTALVTKGPFSRHTTRTSLCKRSFTVPPVLSVCWTFLSSLMVLCVMAGASEFSGETTKNANLS